MNYLKLIVAGIVGLVFFIGDISVGETKGKSRKFAAEAASASGPSPVLPIFLYGQDGPIVLDENMQQLVKVHYRYGKGGKLSGAIGKGDFKIDDGFGNISKGTIKQDYKIIEGQAKLAKNDTDMNTKYLDGAKSKQNINVQYSYDNNGNLQSVLGDGKWVGDDGFANKTEGKISQTFFIFKEQPKLKDSTQDFKTKNVDGSWQNKNLTIIYNYDKTGRLKNASGRGTLISDDGFGNVTEGTIAQNYQIINGQARRVASKESVQPAGRRGRRFVADPASITAMPPPPPPPSKETEIAVRHEPQEEQVAGHCERGTWSPTFRRCIEDKPVEEVKPQDCERGSWSPTLKMCVE